MIIDWVFRLVQRFLRLWNRLDEKTKRQIIEAVIKAFEQLLRAFYRSWKN
jgi:hypothetical protein